MVGGNLDWTYHRCDLSSELWPCQPRPQRAFAHAKGRLGPKYTVLGSSETDFYVIQEEILFFLKRLHPAC
jgi:hypothetical protein